MRTPNGRRNQQTEQIALKMGISKRFRHVMVLCKPRLCEVVMIVDPLRLYKRWRRVRQEAADEAQMLRRRHGEAALEAAQSKLAREDLSTWGRQIMEQTVRILEKAPN